ncbi:protein kinase RIO1 [Ascoidea rubescens DSM 1968]|uniref:Serine/threonine-protein kinase RIO1 n=1 Tax=Ascoidea rubescens DSM 1968 TaxID=1344418 RepID=A0A1D2VN48_9ASCO|nr:RIO1-domain-containing protein [Ascoidea rubescens DSM 1968]ODV63030.1 RIO1-domain-containing protein [Ascoidea rubescens DSM 1968]
MPQPNISSPNDEDTIIEKINRLNFEDLQSRDAPDDDYSDYSDDSDDSDSEGPHQEDINGAHLHDHTNVFSSERGDILQKYSVSTDSQVKTPKILKDKSQRATIQTVLDPRTFKALAKYISNETLTRINGCISTGKEANIYYATKDEEPEPEPEESKKNIEIQNGLSKNNLENQNPSKTSDPSKKTIVKHYAIKIYKTSILIFKDRERYVSGEFRFKNFNQSNPRKMIKIWAEKEFRNLKRLILNNIYCPKPLEVKNNILIMDLLSEHDDGWPSPKLKDFNFIDNFQINFFYFKVLIILRKLYQNCRLIHADLSEYNIIIHRSKIYIIDVSQSVEPNHPMSLDFLRMDIKNINDFFQSKKKIDIIMEKNIFEFIIEDLNDLIIKYHSNQNNNDDHINTYNNQFQTNFNDIDDLEIDNNNDGKNDRILLEILTKLPLKLTDEDKLNDEVFRSTHLITTLHALQEDDDFADFENGKLTTFKSLISKNPQPSKSTEKNSNETSTNKDKSKEDEWEERNVLLKGKKFEDKDAKKSRKKEAKEKAKEKRKTKMKKYDKKRAIKKTQKK